jgi:Eco29kI restriction endonuclease
MSVKSDNDPHYFQFDLDRGIRIQVVEKLEDSPSMPLIKGVGPNESGVYALYFLNELVYIGKASKGTTKSLRSLRARLAEHVAKLSQRSGLSMANVTCRYLVFDSEWWVFAAEFALISHYSPEWNDSGFGSNTPGVGRPGTSRISKFDAKFPKNK